MCLPVFNWRARKGYIQHIEWDKKVNAQGNQTEDDITVKKLFKRFQEYCLPKKNLVVSLLMNLASTCEFGDLHESFLLCKEVDGIRSDKIRDVLLRKGVEMTLEKAINICRTEEITKMQMKEMNSEKSGWHIKKSKMEGST